MEQYHICVENVVRKEIRNIDLLKKAEKISSVRYIEVLRNIPRNREHELLLIIQ